MLKMFFYYNINYGIKKKQKQKERTNTRRLINYVKKIVVLSYSGLLCSH